MNTLQVDDNNIPYYNIRIKHTIVVDDPFDDIDGLEEPESPKSI